MSSHAFFGIVFILRIVSCTEPRGMTLFLRYQDGSGVAQVHPDDTIQELYRAPEISTTSYLTFGQQTLRRDDDTPLSDYGICSESTIEVLPETETIGLYHVISALENKELVPWFDQAFYCTEHPMDDACTVASICEFWRDISCMHHGKSIYSIHFYGSYYQDLGGHLVLKSLPKTVEEFWMAGHQLTSLDLRGLETKALRQLVLANNHISRVILDAGFSQTSIESIDLSRNRISDSMIIPELAAAKTLCYIDLRGNDFQTLQFTDSDVRHWFDPSIPFQAVRLDDNPLTVRDTVRWNILKMRKAHAGSEVIGWFFIICIIFRFVISLYFDII